MTSAEELKEEDGLLANNQGSNGGIVITAPTSGTKTSSKNEGKTLLNFNDCLKIWKCENNRCVLCANI